MRFKVLALLGACLLLAFAFAAPGETEAAPGPAPVPTIDGLLISDGTAVAPPDLGLFTPKAQERSCYTQCLSTEIPIYCGGLSGAELQQCTNGIAEGCRCSCGLYCP